MKPTTDVFLCYRRAGAQTAKLFKKYLEKSNFPASIWYSDSEDHGHLIEDISSLISSAQSAVLFIDKDFTYNFENKECITALEIREIVKRACSDANFRIFEVFLNRERHEFSKEEIGKIEKILCEDSIHIGVITKRNARSFDVFSDDEESLANELSSQLLPTEYYEKSICAGNFSFGIIPTHVDLSVCDFKVGINAKNIYFLMDDRDIKLHRDIQRVPIENSKEIQNNTMISFVGSDITLSDNDEEKIVTVRYKEIEYALFHKALQILGASKLGLRKIISCYQMEDEVFSIPNAMGLAFMVVTADNRLIFTKRSAHRKIRPEEYDVSIVEGLKIDSIDEPDYIENEIRRAYNEEICDDEGKIDIRICALAFDKEYAQWNFIGTVTTAQTSDEIIRMHATRDDTYEKQELFFVSYAENGSKNVMKAHNELSKFVKGKFWGMGLVTLYSALRTIGFTESEIAEISR